MKKYQEYENIFNKQNISERETIVLIEYLTALAEIGINNFNLNEFKYEELRNLD